MYGKPPSPGSLNLLTSGKPPLPGSLNLLASGKPPSPVEFKLSGEYILYLAVFAYLTVSGFTVHPNSSMFQVAIEMQQESRVLNSEHIIKDL